MLQAAALASLNTTRAAFLPLIDEDRISDSPQRFFFVHARIIDVSNCRELTFWTDDFDDRLRFSFLDGLLHSRQRRFKSWFRNCFRYR